MRLIDRLPAGWSGRRRRRRRPSLVGRSAPELRGAGPDGAAVEVAIGDGQSILFFLTTGCLGCRVIWGGLAARAETRPVAAPGSSRIVLVTPDPSTESARTVATLAPQGESVPVVMSSAAWHAYAVTRAPWCVVVRGGVVVSDSPAPADWEEVATLVGRWDGS